MNAKELRFGNFVNDRYGKLLRVDFMTRLKANQIMEIEGQEVHPLTEDYEYLQPIPLTEKWLKKIGAQYQYEDSDETRVYMFQIGMFTFWSDSSNDFSTLEYSDRISVKHVHQLQNLYFALTGEELELNASTSN